MLQRLQRALNGQIQLEELNVDERWALHKEMKSLQSMSMDPRVLGIHLTGDFGYIAYPLTSDPKPTPMHYFFTPQTETEVEPKLRFTYDKDLWQDAPAGRLSLSAGEPAEGMQVSSGRRSEMEINGRRSEMELSGLRTETEIKEPRSGIFKGRRSETFHASQSALDLYQGSGWNESRRDLQLSRTSSRHAVREGVQDWRSGRQDDNQDSKNGFKDWEESQDDLKDARHNWKDPKNDFKDWEDSQEDSQLQDGLKDTHNSWKNSHDDLKVGRGVYKDLKDDSRNNWNDWKDDKRRTHTSQSNYLPARPKSHNSTRRRLQRSPSPTAAYTTPAPTADAATLLVHPVDPGFPCDHLMLLFTPYGHVLHVHRLDEWTCAVAFRKQGDAETARVSLNESLVRGHRVRVWFQDQPTREKKHPGVCFNWNLGECVHKECPLMHICFRCKSHGHAFRECDQAGVKGRPGRRWEDRDSD